MDSKKLQHVADDAARLAAMFASIVALGKEAGSAASISKAAEEAAVRLADITAELEKQNKAVASVKKLVADSLLAEREAALKANSDALESATKLVADAEEEAHSIIKDAQDKAQHIKTSMSIDEQTIVTVKSHIRELEKKRKDLEAKVDVEEGRLKKVKQAIAEMLKG